MNDLVPFQGMDVMELGTVLQKSGYFQDVTQAAQAVVKILAGQELGIGPVAAMTGIYIVKGRITLSAGLMAAQTKRSGRYSYVVREMTDSRCAIEFTENGQSIGVSSFSMDDAKAAGLSGDNWRKFPRNMLFARAMSNGAKWFCPDVFSGPVYTPEELNTQEQGAYIVDTSTGEIIDSPQDTLPTEPQQSTRQAPIAPQKPAQSATGPQTQAEWLDLLQSAWDKELTYGGTIPEEDQVADMSTLTIDEIRARGKKSKERLAALQKAAKQPA